VELTLPALLTKALLQDIEQANDFYNDEK